MVPYGVYTYFPARPSRKYLISDHAGFCQEHIRCRPRIGSARGRVEAGCTKRAVWGFARRHPCYREEVQGTPFPKAYCDAYTQATGIALFSEYSCRDLVNNYERSAKISQERSTAEQASSQRENQCREFGFVEGTPEMANCLLELYKIENQPQQNTVIANPAPSVNNAPNPATGIELMNRGLQILNGAGTPSAPAVTSSSRCTRIGDVSGQVYTFNSPACPAGYAPAF